MQSSSRVQPTVAVIGASSHRAKFGNKSVRAHQAAGYAVFPVNPKGDSVEGLRAYRALADIPVGRLNRVSLYLPPEIGITVLDEIAARGCDELYLNPGTATPELLIRARQLGLNPIQECSIVQLGYTPTQFPD